MEKNKHIIRKSFKMLFALSYLIFMTLSQGIIKLEAEEKNYLTGNEISESVKSLLINSGVKIDDHSIISLGKPVEDSKEGYFLVVTNTEGGYVEKNAVAILDENNNLMLSSLNQLNSTQIHFPNNKNFIIYGTAYYYQYYHDLVTTWYRPVRLDTLYTQSSNSVNLTYFKVQYYTTGGVYTYPGFVDTGNSTVHEISVERSYPVYGVTYSNYYTPYLTNYVIHAFSGGVYTGCMMTFTYIANGVTDGVSIYFY